MILDFPMIPPSEEVNSLDYCMCTGSIGRVMLMNDTKGCGGDGGSRD